MRNVSVPIENVVAMATISSGARRDWLKKAYFCGKSLSSVNKR